MAVVSRIFPTMLLAVLALAQNGAGEDSRKEAPIRATPNIIALVACLLTIPPAIAAIAAGYSWIRKRRRHKQTRPDREDPEEVESHVINTENGVHESGILAEEERREFVQWMQEQYNADSDLVNAEQREWAELLSIRTVKTLAQNLAPAADPTLTTKTRTIVEPVKTDRTMTGNPMWISTDLPGLTILDVSYNNHQRSSNTNRRSTSFPVQRIGVGKQTDSSLRQTAIVAGEKSRDFAEWCQREYEKNDIDAVEKQNKWEVELGAISPTDSGSSKRRRSYAGEAL